MKIIDLTKKNIDSIPRACGSLLPSREREAAREVKKEWVRSLLSKGFKMKLAVDDDGYFMGMIEYLPIDVSLQRVTGKNIAYIDCIWVLNQHQKKGVGRALMEAAFSDTKKFDGVATWATDQVIMNKGFFEAFGFEVVDSDKTVHVMFKKNKKDAEPPKLLKSKFKFEPDKGVLNVDLFYNPWCPYSFGVAQKAKKMVLDSKERVRIKEHYLSSKEIIEKYGLSVGVFLNGKDFTVDFLMSKSLEEVLILI
ncbi:MAG: GNAT family N-acetyltransferase [Armatimonadota bacterium]